MQFSQLTSWFEYMISMDYLGNMGYEIASPQSYLKLIPKQRNQEPA